MKRILRFAFSVLFMVAFVLLFFSYRFIQAQEATPYRPTTTHNVIKNGFPAALYCNDSPSELGPTWNNITIGVSHEKNLLSLSESDIDYFDDGSQSIELGGYRTIQYCTDKNDVITVMWVYTEVDETADFVYIWDLVAAFGTPDVVGYEASTQYLRLVFWFEKGIAASVFVGADGTEFFGYVPAVTYFPYQDAAQYASNYPYLYTCGTEYCGSSDEGNAPTQLAPFNIASILLTATYQPSRTPTPTFTPLPKITSTPQ